MTQTDSELIERSIAGDYDAFEQIVVRYDRDVLNIASRFTGSAEDAKDIYQETFIRVFKGLSSFQHRSEFSTWLFRITTNVCLTFSAKKKSKRMVSLEDQEVSDADLIGGTATDTSTHESDFAETVKTALHQLSPKQRMVFTLRFYHDLKMKEIAERMDCAEGTVKKYLFEATQKMRLLLRQMGT